MVDSFGDPMGELRRRVGDWRASALLLAITMSAALTPLTVTDEPGLALKTTKNFDADAAITTLLHKNSDERLIELGDQAIDWYQDHSEST